VTRSIAFHSYKGGTGKTTIAANLAAKLANEGHNVTLLDLDVYAPSLHVYFDYYPEKWLNDLLGGSANLSEVMIDMTTTINKPAPNSDKKEGKLWIGFSNPQKEEIYKMEGGIGNRQKNEKIEFLRKFIQVRGEIIDKYDCDYIIVDTSPGVRYWSINSLALADAIFLTLKFGDLDIEGTKKMATDLYNSFTKFGARSYLLLNRVAGYCIPESSHAPHSHSHDKDDTGSMTAQLPINDESEIGKTLSEQVGMDLISAVPCYCDIQFSRKEFLTVLEHPDHPFAKQVAKLATSRQIRTDDD